MRDFLNVFPLKNVFSFCCIFVNYLSHFSVQISKSLFRCQTSLCKITKDFFLSLFLFFVALKFCLENQVLFRIFPVESLTSCSSDQYCKVTPPLKHIFVGNFFSIYCSTSRWLYPQRFGKKSGRLEEARSGLRNIYSTRHQFWANVNSWNQQWRKWFYYKSIQSTLGISIHHFTKSVMQFAGIKKVE